MTPADYKAARLAIREQAMAQIEQLNEQLLAVRQYPDGFIIRIERRHKGEWVEVSGPIFRASIEGDGHWYESDKEPGIYYHFQVETPADYKGGGDHPGYPPGKWESTWEAYLLNGTGPDGTIPKQLPPTL